MYCVLYCIGLELQTSDKIQQRNKKRTSISMHTININIINTCKAVR